MKEKNEWNASEGLAPLLDGWYGVTELGASLERARPLYVVRPDGLLHVVRPTAAEAAAQARLDPYEREVARVATEAEARAVVELVRVEDGREVAREAIFVEEMGAFAGPLPDGAEWCWAEIRAWDRDLEATMEATAHWPRVLRECRFAARRARLSALLARAAELGDLSAQERLGHEAFEMGHDEEALRRLADLVGQSALARSILAVMGLERRLPEDAPAPEVSPGSPWPLARPTLRAFLCCREALDLADAASWARTAELALVRRRRAVDKLREAAEAGYAYAQFLLARFLGDVHSEDRVAADEARRWLRAAALGGCREAAEALAVD